MQMGLFVFALLTAISLGYTFTFANALALPEPRGIHGVGTVNIQLSDATRIQLRNHEKRRWMATVFYPTLKTKSMHFYMHETLEGGVVCGMTVLGHAIPDKVIIKGQKFPIVISFPGRGNVRQHNTILYEALASHGYIVIAMDHPYVASFVKFPDKTKITITFKDVWNLPRDRDYRYKYDNEIIESAIKDIDFVLKNFKNFGDLSYFFDETKIILMGHSIGANIAHIKGFADKRIKAIVDIDSKITERAIFGHIGVPPNQDAKPVLFIRGMMSYQENVGDQLTKIANSTKWSPLVQHSAFSDDAYFAAKIPNYGMGFWGSIYNWLFTKGPHFSNTDTSLGDYNVDEWFELFPEYIVKWIDKNIKE